ncbi:hypothetical protein RI129_007612 [Pyrocoelia pectoralis]|uniref:Otopetrin-2 n=1 Tax=Pyrocoelia pectoralis TaxID=417401 RepID=A0AAN7VA00_9COLE
MDTVKEEKSLEEDNEFEGSEITISNPNNVINSRSHDMDGSHDCVTNSRRPSAIIAALRRPSQAIALSAAHAVMNQRRTLLRVIENPNYNSEAIEDRHDVEEGANHRTCNQKMGFNALTTILSALYAKLLVVLGIAIPITDTISTDVNFSFFQGFYLYLYFGSIAFVAYMYITLVKEKPMFSIKKGYRKEKNRRRSLKKLSLSHLTQLWQPTLERYGSLYLRLGAIAFGIGSMVYSGLELARYFELRNNQDCDSNVLQAVTPASRMLLTLVQIQFIFLNSKDIELNRHKIVARFGLMHMIATNLCQWLYVIVEETKHEIMHLAELSNTTSMQHKNHCVTGFVMGSVVQSASTILFPCTIEYSLICAVILYEMWKKIEKTRKGRLHTKSSCLNHDRSQQSQQNPGIFEHSHRKSSNHISVDCSNAHKGLFAGILVIVLTIISLILFFVLNNESGTTEQQKRLNKMIAKIEVNAVEIILYLTSTFAVVLAMYRMKNLKYDRRTGGTSDGLDITLLVVAQTGMFIYCMFSIIGCYYTIAFHSSAALVAEVFSFIQTCLQTMFVLDGWWRRCRNLEQTKRKPGRELVTFLIIANMAMWTISAMEKNRAEFRPTLLQFFGNWPWTIITHISMPLAIFYRFHSTICLFEIWKSAYKIKGPYGKHPLLPYLQT